MSVKMNKLLAAIGALVLTQSVYAGSCAAPTSLHPQEPGTSISGNTCDGGETGQWFFNGFAWPHRSEVYSFTYNNNETGPITIGPAPVEAIILDRDTCEGAEVVWIASQAAPGDIGDAPLVNGQTYLLLVGAENTQAAGACGAFTLNYAQLPVELQSFSID